MKRFGSVLLAISLLAASCSTSQKAPDPVETPTLVGTVENVYSSHKYVLVRINGIVPEAGTTLVSQSGDSEGRVANLVVSAERLDSQRVPADIRSGSVEKGDYVYLYKRLAPPAQAETEETSSSAAIFGVAPKQDEGSGEASVAAKATGGQSEAPPADVIQSPIDAAPEVPAESKRSKREEDMLDSVPGTLQEAITR